MLAAVRGRLASMRGGAASMRPLTPFATLGLASAAAAASPPPPPLPRPQSPPAGGIDCGCYFSENFYVRKPVEAHFSFVDRPTFEAENAELLANLPSPSRDALIDNLEAEAERRRRLPTEATQRKLRIAAEYAPKHPSLWTLSEEWLHPDFVSFVRGLGTAGGALPPSSKLAEGVYALPVFSRRFCELLCEELDSFAASGLPCGRPNSMNRFGALLDELGFSPGLVDPLVREWLRPLATSLPALAAAGGATLDHHKAFVVTYRLGEDEELAQHFDNAEVTLNVNLGLEFSAGELLFYGHKLSAAGSPAAYHEWRAGVGHGVLHLGAQVHAALPIESGERRNLVVWMRSWKHRRRHGCPMCERSDRLLG